MKDQGANFFERVFVPPFIASVAVGIIALGYEVTVSSVLLFASVGASALILARRTSRELTRLRITIFSYGIAAFVSVAVFELHQFVNLPVSLGLALTVFFAGFFMLYFDVFHPPAVTAALSFFLLDRPLTDLLILFSAIVILLIFVRFVVYTFVLKYPTKQFIPTLFKHF